MADFDRGVRPLRLLTRQRGSSVRIALAVLLSVLLVGCFDSMYPTDKYHAPCKGYSLDEPVVRYCQTDGLLLTYFYQASLTSADKTALRLGLDEYEATDLDPTYDSSPSYSGSNETDIVFLKGAGVPSGLLGIAYCDNAATSLRCDQHFVRLRSTEPVRRMTACHEVGHAVGLTHGSDADAPQRDDSPDIGCLRRPYDILSYRLGPHNTRQINDTYN